MYSINVDDDDNMLEMRKYLNQNKLYSDLYICNSIISRKSNVS